MIRYLMEKTPMCFHAFADFPDYQPYMPGAKRDGGRSLDNEAFSFEQLGKWAHGSIPVRWPTRCAAA